MVSNICNAVKLPHHEQQELCMTRPKYRQGRKFTAVKVYTVSSESAHLLIFGVPALGLRDEVKRLCQKFGDVAAIAVSPRADDELFTDTYHVKYTRIVSARFGKRAMDNRNFFGGILHVCYAPEFESMEETRAKLAQRRRDVAKRTKLNEGAGEKSNQHDNSGASAAAKASTSPPQAPCVWAGTPYSRDPRSITASRIVPSEAVLQPFGPQPPDEEWIRAGVRERRIIASHPHALRPAFSAHTPAPTPPPEPTPVPTLAPASMTSRSALPHTTPAATATVPDTKLTKFVPRQLKVKAVVFRKNRRQRHGDE